MAHFADYTEVTNLEFNIRENYCLLLFKEILDKETEHKICSINGNLIIVFPIVKWDKTFNSYIAVKPDNWENPYQIFKVTDS